MHPGYSCERLLHTHAIHTKVSLGHTQITIHRQNEREPMKNTYCGSGPPPPLPPSREDWPLAYGPTTGIANHIYQLGQPTPRPSTGSDLPPSDSGSGTTASVSCQSSVDRGDHQARKMQGQISKNTDQNNKEGNGKTTTRKVTAWGPGPHKASKIMIEKNEERGTGRSYGFICQSLGSRRI